MTSDQQQARAVTLTTPTDREIHVERVFDAPRDWVFAAFTDPNLIPKWWGPTTTVDQMDVRPGGSWRFVFRNADGTSPRSVGPTKRSRRQSASCRPSSGEKGMNESYGRLDQLLARLASD